MFSTFGNTLKLLRISMDVLLRERDLIYFPMLSSIALIFVLAYVFIALSAGGAVDRIANGAEFHTADFVFIGIAYFGASFVIVYFNTALVAAAHYRLMGGAPDFRFGLEAANDRLGAIFVWSAISGTVGVLLRQLANNHGIVGRVAGFIVEALWAWATFMVVPVMVVESATPLEAMRRSTELFKETWGRQLVANFGFGVVYFVLTVVAVAPAVLIYLATSSLVLPIAVGAWIYIFGGSMVRSLEAVFAVALYNYATSGHGDGVFPDEFLRDAYVHKSDRGRFGPPSIPRRAAA
jgi:hypothetical protein